jgi:hypothetical protein
VIWTRKTRPCTTRAKSAEVCPPLLEPLLLPWFLFGISRLSWPPKSPTTNCRRSNPSGFTVRMMRMRVFGMYVVGRVRNGFDSAVVALHSSGEVWETSLLVESLSSLFFSSVPV